MPIRVIFRSVFTILAREVKHVLADVDADHGDCAARFPRHGVLLFGAPSQLRSLAGLEHGRTIPFWCPQSSTQRTVSRLHEDSS